MPTFLLRRRRHLRGVRRSAVSTVCAVLLLIGCGTAADSETDGGGIPDGYPTIASSQFHATFEITGATIGGRPVDLETATTGQISFDVVTGATTVDLGCEQRLGSFTLDDGGQASITLTGRVDVDPCPPSNLDEALVELIDRIERWETADGGFRLLAAGGDGLVLAGR